MSSWSLEVPDLICSGNGRIFDINMSRMRMNRGESDFGEF